MGYVKMKTGHHTGAFGFKEIFLQTFTPLTAGDWLMFLAHYWRSQGPGPLPQAELMAAEEANTTQTELAIWYLAIQYYNTI